MIDPITAATFAKGVGSALGQPIAALINAANSHLRQAQDHKHRERMAIEERRWREALRASDVWEKANLETWPLTSPPDWYSESVDSDHYEPLHIFLSVSGVKVSLNQSTRREVAIFETSRVLLDRLYFSGVVNDAVFVSDGWREGRRLGRNTLNTLSNGFAKPFLVVDAFCTEREVTITIAYRPGGKGTPFERFPYSAPFTLAQLLPQRAAKLGKAIKNELTRLVEEKKASPAIVRLLSEGTHEFRGLMQNYEVDELVARLEENGISREQVGLGAYTRGLFSDYEDADVIGALLCTISGCLSEADGLTRRGIPLKPIGWMSPVLDRIKDQDVASLAIACCKQALDELKSHSKVKPHMREVTPINNHEERSKALVEFLSTLGRS